jgi:hypothetical protein
MAALLLHAARSLRGDFLTPCTLGNSVTALWSSLLQKYPINGCLTKAHGVMQNVPMGILNLNYLIRSMLEVMILRLEAST